MLGNVNPWLYLSQNWPMVRHLLSQHVELTFVAIALGLVISLPLAVIARRFPRWRGPIVGLSATMYIIPSLALFAIVGAWLGYYPPGNFWTAETGLAGYTMLILVWNILAGLAAVPADAREAAIAAGYTELATLVRVELPLAIPYLIAGLRVATATVIGLVPVTLYIGLGGFGQLFNYGFQADYSSPIIDGLILCIVLAALCDLAWVGIGRVLVPWSRTSRRATAAARV